MIKIAICDNDRTFSLQLKEIILKKNIRMKLISFMFSISQKNYINIEWKMVLGLIL